jgi:endonuclease/exonuclease/phosphatase family metal-dependent hydrolase
VVARVVADASPDVLLVQEIRRGQARTLARLLGWNLGWARKHHPYSPALPWLSEGLAIVSPHRLIDQHHRSISPGVSTWIYRHRIVVASTVERGSDRLRVYDTHLASGAAADERIAQARRVADLVIGEGAPHRIVGGDLNAAGEREVIREFHRAGLRDPGGGPTHPSIAPTRRLDHILIPAASRLLEQHEPDGGQAWWEISDHLPVTVEFELAP